MMLALLITIMLSDRIPCDAQSHEISHRSVLGEASEVARPEPETATTVPTQSAEVLTYDEAYRQAIADDVPLVVYATSNGCVPCVQMWRDTMLPLLHGGEFSGVRLAKVNLSEQPKLGSRLKVAATPALAIFYRRSGQWQSIRTKGRMPIENVRRILRGLK